MRVVKLLQFLRLPTSRKPSKDKCIRANLGFLRGVHMSMILLTAKIVSGLLPCLLSTCVVCECVNFASLSCLSITLYIACVAADISDTPSHPSLVLINRRCCITCHQRPFSHHSGVCFVGMALLVASCDARCCVACSS